MRSCAIDDGTAGHDAVHVALVDQLLRNPLEEIPQPAGVLEFEVQIVQEDQEDAAGRVGRRSRRRQDDALLGRRRRRGLEIERPSAMDEDERDDFLLDAVFPDLEIGLREIRRKQAVLVANDGVRGDQIDRRPEGRLERSARLLGRRLRGKAGSEPEGNEGGRQRLAAEFHERIIPPGLAAISFRRAPGCRSRQPRPRQTPARRPKSLKRPPRS